jgi:hypothetical protein
MQHSHYFFIIIRHNIFVNIFIDFRANLARIAYNVPAVYDVWAGIKGLCAAKTVRPNVPE